MKHDTTQYDETTETRQYGAPPLSLVEYLAEREGHPPEQSPHPPGSQVCDHRVKHRGDLILVTFAEPPTAPPLKLVTPRKKWQGSRSRKSVLERACNILLALLLLASFVACVEAFRF